MDSQITYGAMDVMIALEIEYALVLVKLKLEKIAHKVSSEEAVVGALKVHTRIIICNA